MDCLNDPKQILEADQIVASEKLNGREAASLSKPSPPHFLHVLDTNSAIEIVFSSEPNICEVIPAGN